jgi:hypothetical protein
MSGMVGKKEYSIAPEAKANLTPTEEKKFQQDVKSSDWYKEYKQNYGEDPNLNSKDYNYRAAWKSGAKPEKYAPDENKYHWPSETSKGESLKALNHPTAWMEDYMQLTGKDPHEGKGMTEGQSQKMKQFLIQRYGKGK